MGKIPTVIKNIESYDTTTVRASVGNYLVAKYIKENTDIVVVFNGDGSDEQSGYKYLRNAPNPEAFNDECNKLINNIQYFDVLRSDRSVSSKWSLEARTPFLDKEFVQYYMTIDPKLKMYGDNGLIEKYLLRKAFSGHNIIPVVINLSNSLQNSSIIACLSLQKTYLLSILLVYQYITDCHNLVLL